MKINHIHHMRKGFSLVELLVVIAIIASLAGVAYGPIMKQVKAASKSNAITSSKNLHAAFLSYANKNDGFFPNEDTASGDESADTPEACFTQLINSGDLEDEEIFWSKENMTIGTVKSKPNLNGVVDPGESGWGYVAGLNSSSRGKTPLIFDASNEAGIFDTAVWDGSSIVLTVAGSAKEMKISVSSGGPFNEDGSSKRGPIVIKRGDTEVNIFSEEALPGNAVVLAPEGDSNSSDSDDDVL